MSYEGYTEYLCAEGHRWQIDAMEEAMQEDCGLGPLCPRCRKPSIWSHCVDETNGIVCDENGVPDPDTLPYPLEVERYEEITIRVPIYKIPADAAKG